MKFYYMRMAEKELNAVFLLFSAHRSLYETQKERMGPVRTALELGMELHADKELLSRNLDGLYEPSVRRKTRKAKPGFLQGIAEIIIHFISVAMTLADLFPAVQPADDSPLTENSRILATTQSSAPVYLVILAGQEGDYRIRGIGIELA